MGFLIILFMKKDILLCVLAALACGGSVLETKAQCQRVCGEVCCQREYRFLLENEDVVLMPEIGVQFVWFSQYAELYILKAAEHKVTELHLNGEVTTTLALSENVLAVYGIAQMEWEEDVPVLLAEKDGVRYYADVWQYDDRVELRVLAGEKIIFEKSWHS